MRDGTAKRLSQLHTRVYRLTSGVVGRRLVSNDMLLLTTTGRLSGTPHTVPLLYLRDGGRFVVFASWGGRPHHPQWYQNLLADPAAEIQVERTRMPVEAVTAAGAERARWWAAAERAYKGYAVYQSKTDREIPVVLLDPR